MTSSELKQAVHSGAFDRAFGALYAGEALPAVRARYAALAEAFEKEFSVRDAVSFFSAPGRSEIAGNHTDHQHGAVLAAAVSLDFIAAARRHRRNTVTVASHGYPRFQIGLDNMKPRLDEKNSTKAFVRGVAAYLKAHGYTVGGFETVMQSNVPRGSGLSSSAAYGVLLGTVWNGLYNGGRITFTEIALAAQYAENQYFGKPSGLMDQIASAAGGFVAVDFLDPTQPRVERIDCDLEGLGYAVCIVNAGGSHASLTGEYADIPGEMAAVSSYFGRRVLREVDRDAFYDALPLLRQRGVPDRAILRSMHFFDETERAVQARDALKSGDMPRFLAVVNASGRSSEALLQNVCPKNKKERSVSLALALSEKLLAGRGAYRVHGGGFAGTIQAIVPLAGVEAYAAGMEQVFGRGCCYRLRIRPLGGVLLQPDAAPDGFSPSK